MEYLYVLFAELEGSFFDLKEVARDGHYCVSSVFFGHVLKDLGQVLCHVNVYLDLCAVFQSNSQILVQLSSVDGELCVLAAPFSNLGDHFWAIIFGRSFLNHATFHVGIFLDH